MNDPWLNFQYTIEFSDSSASGRCSVLSINSNSVKHGTGSYMVNPVKGDPVRKYVYGGTYTEPINISILLGEGARPWLQWFSDIQSGKKAETRNVTLKLFGYGRDPLGPDSEKNLWLKWDLINCFPTEWTLKPMSISDSPSPMELDMVLQFESMVISDGNSELSEAMG